MSSVIIMPHAIWGDYISKLDSLEFYALHSSNLAQ